MHQAVEHLGVDGLVLGELAGPELLQPGLERLDGLDPLFRGVGRAVFELVVVLVQSGGGAFGGLPGEVGVEVVVHEGGERRRHSRPRPTGRQPVGQIQQPRQAEPPKPRTSETS